MNKQMRQIKIPEYLTNFECIGSECPDTCCAGWKVDIDKKTFKNYRQVTSKELKPVLQNNIKRNRKTTSDSDYAYIQLKQDYSCPMLDEEKLCMVHKELGHKALSNTCATYPRVTTIIDDEYIQAATMSCPEIVRLSLFNKDPMIFVEKEESIKESISVMRNIKTNQYFHELREFAVWTLQNRNYTIAERMVLIGVVYESADKMFKDEQHEHVTRIIQTYKSALEQNQRIELEFPMTKESRISIQLEILKTILNQRTSEGINNPRYYQSGTEFLEGIKYDDSATNEQAAKNYQEAYAKWYQPFFADKEYIFENYLVNYIYKNGFPSSGYETVFDEYIMMTLHFALIKMHLIGLAAFHKENFNEEVIAKLIQSFAKTVEHNGKYLSSINEYLHDNNLVHMTCMGTLITN